MFLKLDMQGQVWTLDPAENSMTPGGGVDMLWSGMHLQRENKAVVSAFYFSIVRPLLRKGILF